jgi:hypothetical protein
MATEPTPPHQIIATPKDRWHLALFLLRKGLSFKTRAEQKVLHRAKNVLDLHGPTTGFMSESKGTMELANDETPNLFEVTAEVAEFFPRLLNEIKEPPMMAHELAGLEPVLQQLEEKSWAAKVVAEHPDAKPLDPKAEHWVRTSAPILENPARFVDVINELFRRHPADPRTEPALAAFQEAFAEESEPPKPGKQKPGRLAPEPEQQAPS